MNRFAIHQWVSMSALSIGLSVAGSAYAVSETFTYPNGALEGAGGAGQWTGPWVPGTESAPPLGTSPFQVESGQMKLDLTDTAAYIYNESDVRRTLATPISSSSVYISFEITPGEMGDAVPDPTTPQLGARTNSYAGLNIGFADSPANIGVKGPMISTFEYFEFFTGTTSVRFGTSLDGIYDGQSMTISNWTPGNTYRLVGRLDFDPGGPGTEEVWTVWLDPANESDTPQVITSSELGYNSIGLAQMYHYIYNFQNTQDSLLDNLRIGSTWASVIPSPADLDGDGDVDGVDLSSFFSAFTGPGGGPPGNPQADLDGDGDVDGVDLSSAFSAFTGPLAPAIVPEPGSIALLGIGLIAIRRRR